jgi:hypothetical protein
MHQIEKVRLLKIFMEVWKYDILKSEKDKKLADTLAAKWFLLESGFIVKMFIDKKTNKIIQRELFINWESTFWRKRKFLVNLYISYI